MERRNHHPFTIIIVVFFIVRLSLLFLAIDELIYCEECHRALIAKQLIDGPIVPFFDLQVDSYSGGSLVVGLLMVPFFTLFGQNLISLKLVALLFSLAALISWYLFCIKFFDKRVGIVTTLLFILPPPFFTKHTLITMGFHTESILFSILLIFVFFEIFFNHKKYNSYFILLGLISGFGVWFTYIFSITLFTCVLFWFLLDRGFFLRKSFLIFLIACIFGVSPWIYYNLTHSFSGLHILRIGGKTIFPPFSTDHLIFSLAKLKNLLLHDIRNSFLFENYIPLGANYLSTFYYLIFIASFAVLFWLNRWPIYLLIRRVIPLKRFQISPASIPKETFFLIHVVIFSLIYSLSHFKLDPALYGFMGYRYLVTLYPFIFILIALFLSNLQESKIKGKVFVYSFSLITILSIGLASNLKLISFKKIDISFFDIDYNISYMVLGEKIGMKYRGDIDKCISVINQVEERYRPHLYRGLGLAIGQQCVNDIDECISVINQVEERYRPHLYKALGFVIARRFRNNINKGINVINRVEGRYRFYLYKGARFIIARQFANDIDKGISVINRVEEQYRSNLYEGLGFVIAQQFGNDIDKCLSVINRVEERYRSHLYQALGFAISQRFRNDIDKCINLKNRVEEKYKPYIYEGLGTGVAMVVNWPFNVSKGFVAHCCSLINGEDERNKIAFYKGLGNFLNWNQVIWYFSSKYKIVIEREVEDKYKSYVYEELEKTF